MSRWSFDEQQQVGIVTVTGMVTVTQVGALRSVLLEALDQSPRVRVDLGQIDEIDVAGIQLICAAYRQASVSGKLLEVSSAGEHIRQLVRSAGFAHAAVCDSERKSACLWAGWHDPC